MSGGHSVNLLCTVQILYGLKRARLNSRVFFIIQIHIRAFTRWLTPLPARIDRRFSNGGERVVNSCQPRRVRHGVGGRVHLSVSVTDIKRAHARCHSTKLAGYPQGGPAYETTRPRDHISLAGVGRRQARRSRYRYYYRRIPLPFPPPSLFEGRPAVTCEGRV